MKDSNCDNKVNKNNDFVSIIIPVYNEENYIGSCLTSVRQLDYRADLIEVIVVDNGSEDRTIEIVKNFNCRIEVFPKINVSALRNRGAKIARGNILAFLDADCTVECDWIKNALTKFNDPQVGVVGCSKFLIPDNSSWIEKAWNSQKKKIEGYVSWVGSGNLIIKKDLFEGLDGFNEGIITSEDCDLCFKLAKLNFKVYSTASVSVTHLKYNKTIKDFIKKEIWHGKGVLTTFLSFNFKLSHFKSLAFAFFYAVCIIGIPISIVVWIVSKQYFPLLLFISSIIIFPFILAIVKSRTSKTIVSLSILYFFYGIARALSIFNINNWLLRNKIHEN